MEHTGVYIKEPLGYLRLAITPLMIAAAKRRDAALFERYGRLGTHLDGTPATRFRGFIGEQGARLVFPMLQWSKDIHVDFTCCGLTLDVKTQAGTLPPAPNHTAGYVKDGHCSADWLIWCKVNHDLTMMWIVGAILRAEFEAPANLVPLGTKNPNFTVDKGDRHEVLYARLKLPMDMIRMLDTLQTEHDRAMARQIKML